MKLTFKEVRALIRYMAIAMAVVALFQSDLVLAIKWFVGSSILNDIEFEIWKEEQP